MQVVIDQVVSAARQLVDRGVRVPDVGHGVRTIRKVIMATVELADPCALAERHTACVGVREGTAEAATTTVQGVIGDIYFATVVGQAVTIGKAGLTDGQTRIVIRSASRFLTALGELRILLSAGDAARATACGVTQICFTAVGGVAITVSPTGLTRYEFTLARGGAFADAVFEHFVTAHATGAAVQIASEVDFTTVSGVAIAIGPACSALDLATIAQAIRRCGHTL